MDNPYKDIAPEDIIRMQEESMMDEIMPVLSMNLGLSSQLSQKYLMKAQRDADRKWMIEWLRKHHKGSHNGFGHYGIYDWEMEDVFKEVRDE